MNDDLARWRSDPALRVCSLAARGLWWELVPVMREGEPFGHLVINGHSPSPRQVAILVGETDHESVTSLLAELILNGALRGRDDGVLFSRAMVRDAKHGVEGRCNVLAEHSPSEIKPLADTRRVDAKPLGESVKIDARLLSTTGEEVLPKKEVRKKASKLSPPPPKTLAESVPSDSPSPTAPLAESLAEEKTDTRRVTPESAREANPEVGFLEFWDAYPRKDDRGHALNAYRKARNKKQVAHNTIMAGLRAYQFHPTDRRLRPMPATWLNGERWADNQEVDLLATPEPAPKAAVDDPWGLNAWIAKQDTGIGTHKSGDQRTTLHGMFVEAIAAEVAEAARLDPHWRGSWDALGEWLRDDIDISSEVLAAIARTTGRLAERNETVHSMALFNSDVRAASSKRAA